jgi:hypothetical protein
MVGPFAACRASGLGMPFAALGSMPLQKRKAVTLTVFFLDGTKKSFSYPQQSGTDKPTIVNTIREAIAAERLVLEVEGDLMMIPMAAVKYVTVSPAPAHLPYGVFREVQPVV